jgi:hypothetical protein
MGDEGSANPQSHDWGYHLMPAQAGFNAGLTLARLLRIGSRDAAVRIGRRELISR